MSQQANPGNRFRWRLLIACSLAILIPIVFSYEPILWPLLYDLYDEKNTEGLGKSLANIMDIASARRTVVVIGFALWLVLTLAVRAVLFDFRKPDWSEN